ncbi:hypothetical protein Tco_1551511 [Tanacetum coccineum]
MAGYKHNQLKNKSFDDIQKLFDKAMKTVNTFVDIDTELVEGSEVRAEEDIAQESSSKRAGTELEQESIKKQKLDEDKETTELQRLIKVVPDKEEVAIDAIPLASKPPSIVDWKIHKLGKKSYYQKIRTDESSKMYLVFSHMHKSFDREDLETLYKFVKAKYGSTRPVEDLDLVLYGDLKTMFKPHVEDNQNVHIHMLVEKRYPLTALKSYKSIAQPSKQSSFTRSSAPTKFKGKEIAKPITPPSESTSEEDSDPEQAQRDKDM